MIRASTLIRAQAGTNCFQIEQVINVESDLPTRVWFSLFYKVGGPNKRFKAVRIDYPGWDECSDCTITRGDAKPVYEAPP